MGLALGSLSASAAVDCVQLSVSVKHAVAADRASVLEIVTKQINANPGCACEVVKAAVEGAQADATIVAAIVEAAAVAAPDQMRLIAQCAIAVAPDSLTKVQAVVAKLDPGKGEGGRSAKGAKGGAAEPASADNNPLDFPEGPSRSPNQIGPRPGDTPNGQPFGGNDPTNNPGLNSPDPRDVETMTITEIDPGAGGDDGDDEGED